MKVFTALATLLSCLLLPAGYAGAQTPVPGWAVNPLSADELTKQPFDSTYFVFGDSAFPIINLSRQAKGVGLYRVSARYFDQSHNEVKTAAKPGRYGAVVKIRDGAGVVRDTRFVTLFRAPRVPPLGPDGRLPGLWAAYGLAPQQVVAQVRSVEEYNTETRSPSNRLPLPVLLAGMSESRAGDPTVQRFSAQERDRRWWYEQKKLLGLVTTYRHIVEVPPGYDKGNEKYPVLLFLHGSGERGNDVEQVRVHGPLRLVREGKTLPFIVVAPQCEPGDRWLPRRVVDLLDEVAKKYRVDTSRVYLTGLSMGGYGTWATALEFPDRFAAIVPICGGGDPQDARRLATLPVWDFHGGKDPTVPVALSQQMVDALRAAGSPEVFFKIYPDAGHDSWTETYNNPAVYAWLLEHKR